MPSWRKRGSIISYTHPSSPDLLRINAGRHSVRSAALLLFSSFPACQRVPQQAGQPAGNLPGAFLIVRPLPDQQGIYDAAHRHFLRACRVGPVLKGLRLRPPEGADQRPLQNHRFQMAANQCVQEVPVLQALGKQILQFPAQLLRLLPNPLPGIPVQLDHGVIQQGIQRPIHAGKVPVKGLSGDIHKAAEVAYVDPAVLPLIQQQPQPLLQPPLPGRRRLCCAYLIHTAPPFCIFSIIPFPLPVNRFV